MKSTADFGTFLTCTITNVSTKTIQFTLSVFDETGNRHDFSPLELAPNQSSDAGPGVRAGHCTWTFNGSKNDVRAGINVTDGNAYLSHADAR